MGLGVKGFDTCTPADGSIGSQMQTVWSEKGREFIYNTLNVLQKT